MTGTGTDIATVAWFHCFAGIAGDMALGSLVDAGADADEVRALLDRLTLPGWELRFEEGLRGGLACTRAVVGGDDTVIRTHGAIVALIAAAALPPRVTARALSVFHALAVVEADLHRRPLDQVHFHEVGGHDAIVDVVGTAAALEVLDVDDVRASAVATGMGMVRSAHGALPNPAPATVRLLEGVPTYGRDVSVELTTPTGAALLAALCSSFGPLPAMTITASGFGGGAGEMDDLPNCTQVVIGRQEAQRAAGPGQPAVVLETNLDDVDRRTARACRRRLPRRGSLRRVGEPGHHEEGTSGPRPARPDGRHQAGAHCATRSSGSPARWASAQSPSSGGPSPVSSSRSSSTASRSAV